MILLKVKPEENVTLNISEEKSVNLKAEAVKTVEVPGGGTSDHSELINRDLLDQHPIDAITGLEEALRGKQPAGAYLTEETDPTVPKWAKQSEKPTYTASEVGADPTGSASEALKSANDYTDKQISAHNTATNAHNDIRLLIEGLTSRLNALANSDDTTLDQMAEVVAYIKDNRELIEQVTTGKVSVSDIVDNLTTNVSDKPLSAAQGVVLKGLIDSIVIPVKVSAFENDAGYLTEHQDLSDYAKRNDIPTFESEVWTFELEDGSTVTKSVVIG